MSRERVKTLSLFIIGALNVCELGAGRGETQHNRGLRKT